MARMCYGILPLFVIALRQQLPNYHSEVQDNLLSAVLARRALLNRGTYFRVSSTLSPSTQEPSGEPNPHYFCGDTLESRQARGHPAYLGAEVRMFVKTLTKTAFVVILLSCTTSLWAQHRSNSGARPYYGGGHHTTPHGGHYQGETNSHHKCGHYVNPQTNNRYGVHKAH